MTTPAVRVAVTLGALRVPPTYFAFSHARHLSDVEFRYFAAFADVREPAPWQVVTAPGGQRGSGRQRRAVGGLTWPLLGRSIDRFVPQVIHQQFATWSSVAIRAARRRGVPLVVSLHGYDVPAAANGAQGSRGLLAAPARYLAASQHLAREAVRLGFPADRVDVLYVGVDTEFFTPASPADRLSAWAGRRVCLVGRLSPEKGADDLLRAVAQLPAGVRPGVDLVGDGPQRATLAALADQLRLDVHFHGLTDRAGVLTALRSAAVVALPSREHSGRRETAGLALLEAQACGVPVVAYHSGGTAEMVDPRRPEALVREGDVAGLAASLEKALGLTADEALTIGDSGVQFARTERSERGAAATLRSLYLELAGTA